MNMITVTSSNIDKIGYEAGTLYVAFNNDGLYTYNGVPESVYKSLMSASSHGSYLAQQIKGVYPCTKLR